MIIAIMSREHPLWDEQQAGKDIVMGREFRMSNYVVEAKDMTGKGKHRVPG
jgi:hypothetical protein